MHNGIWQIQLVILSLWVIVETLNSYLICCMVLSWLHSLITKCKARLLNNFFLCVGDISELRLISFPKASSIVEEPSPDIEEICPISDEPEATVWNGNPKTFEWVQDDVTECNVPPRIWELPMPTLKKPKASCCFCFINGPSTF